MYNSRPRWRQLRNGANSLESLIWMYRTWAASRWTLTLALTLTLILIPALTLALPLPLILTSTHGRVNPNSNPRLWKGREMNPNPNPSPNQARGSLRDGRQQPQLRPAREGAGGHTCGLSSDTLFALPHPTFHSGPNFNWTLRPD